MQGYKPVKGGIICTLAIQIKETVPLACHTEAFTNGTASLAHAWPIKMPAYDFTQLVMPVSHDAPIAS